MGVGFHLTGRYEHSGQSVESWLDSVGTWLEANAGAALEHVRVGEDEDARPTLFAGFHPCAEELEIVIPQPGKVAATAKTSTAGPGYHIYACDIVKNLGQALRIEWDEPDENSGTGDETSYFKTGDRNAVVTEFHRWLGSVASHVLQLLEQSYDELSISLSIGHRYPHRGPVATPLGPRDLDWLKRVAANPSQGNDLFPWWSEGLGGGFFLGRALTHLWGDIRWRPPLTAAEGDLMMDVHLDLCRAYACDPSLAIPWREWRELMQHLESHFGYVAREEGDVEPLVNQRAAESTDEPMIGYRRKPVRVELTGGWSIEIPGEMAEEWDEEGTWSAWDGRRTVWFSSFTLTAEDGDKPSAATILQSRELPEGERFQHQGQRVQGIATFSPHEEDGKAIWRLSGQTAASGTLGVSNVFVPTQEDRDRALEIWRSLDCAAGV
jgi:hypothetical protein